MKYDNVINQGSRIADEQVLKVWGEKRRNETVIMDHGKENVLRKTDNVLYLGQVAWSLLDLGSFFSKMWVLKDII